MDTLRTFVLGIPGAEKDEAGKRLFYSKPDPNAEGFEERRYHSPWAFRCRAKLCIGG